jgi:hypothetical protein
LEKVKGPELRFGAFSFEGDSQQDAGSTKSPPLAAAVIELVLGHFAAQRVTVNAKEFRSPALIAVGALQHALDKALLEFADGFLEQNPAFHHLSHEAFQLISHVRTLQNCDFS